MALSQSKMPPQQGNRLPDLFGRTGDFRAHGMNPPRPIWAGGCPL